MTLDKIHDLDALHVWHPCAQMKDYEQFKPLVITHAQGSYLELSDGKKIIDAISSWWCKSLGHGHTALKKALLIQLEKFEHVILANATNEIIVKLSEQLTNLMPHLSKVFYASDGACAVEIAMKMSVQARVIEGQSQRNKFIALRNGYHGETLGALSVTDCNIFRQSFTSLLFNCHFIDVPYVNSTDDPKWHNADEHWQTIEKSLEFHINETTAIVFEPIIQGSAGMKLYSKDFLARLANWATQHNIHLIADEIMTGICRTGKMLACEHAEIQPDFVCLSKGVNSGFLPISAVITTDKIYHTFYDDYATGKMFIHSHTHAGNALAASVTSATLEIMQQENMATKANNLHTTMKQYFLDLAKETGKLNNIRGIGGIIAADLLPNGRTRTGYEFFRHAIKLGAYIRPLGNTIFWFPPLNIEEHTLEELNAITLQAIKLTY